MEEYLSPILTQIIFNMFKYLQQISTAYGMYPERANDLIQSFNSTQYKSKKWLVDEMSKWVTDDSPSILIIGGWYGSYLIPMIKERYKDCTITHTDKDPLSVKIASTIHQKATNCTFEVFDTDVVTKQYDVDIVINTSCEHMQKIGFQAISNKHNSLFVLQACDSTQDPGHINSPIDTKDFSKKCNLSTELFCGRIGLGHKNRFMAIGFK